MNGAFQGNLEKKNTGLLEAEKSLKVIDGKLFTCAKGSRSFLTTKEEGFLEEDRSYYHKYVRRGADIIPRPLWFVDIKSHPKLGVNTSAPYVETSEVSQKTAKEDYKEISLKGNVEKEFLYATLLSTDLIPFGHLDFRIVVLPLIKEEEGYSMLKEKEASKKGFYPSFKMAE